MADIRSVVCAQCGSAFIVERKPGAPPKTCSAECRQVRIKTAEEAKRRARGALPIAEHKLQRRALATRQCSQCGKGFLASGGGPNLYCSTGCRGDSQRLYGSKREAKGAAYRRWAERQGVVPMSRRSIISALKRRTKVLQDACKTCAQCDRLMPDDRKGYQGAPHICGSCARSNAKAQKRAARLARKALERTQTVERFDPLEVLERDGWRCHICGVNTPKRLRGTYADNAPELDHIIPLAAGGEHSRRNTACACRKCNIKKSDRPLGQLLLIA